MVLLLIVGTWGFEFKNRLLVSSIVMSSFSDKISIIICSCSSESFFFLPVEAFLWIRCSFLNTCTTDDTVDLAKCIKSATSRIVRFSLKNKLKKGTLLFKMHLLFTYLFIFRLKKTVKKAMIIWHVPRPSAVTLIELTLKL